MASREERDERAPESEPARARARAMAEYIRAADCVKRAGEVDLMGWQLPLCLGS